MQRSVSPSSSVSETSPSYVTLRVTSKEHPWGIVDGHSSVILRKGVDGLAECQFHGASDQHQNF